MDRRTPPTPVPAAMFPTAQVRCGGTPGDGSEAGARDGTGPPSFGPRQLFAPAAALMVQAGPVVATDGQICPPNGTAIPVTGALAPATSVQIDAGSGPLKRQKGPMPTASSSTLPGSMGWPPISGQIASSVHRYDAGTGTLSPAAVPRQVVPPGSGPRHLLFSPHGRLVFLNAESTGEACGYRWGPGEGRLAEAARGSLDAPDCGGNRSASGIEGAKQARRARPSRSATSRRTERPPRPRGSAGVCSTRRLRS